MRHAATELRAILGAIVAAIDVEGALLLGGIAILTVIAWTVDWRLGAGVIAVAMLLLGVLFARPARI